MSRCLIVGGGAAGFFLAINLKEMLPSLDVTIVERSSRVLSKVAVSGGGRCNCTNTFRDVRDLSAVYPRGHRLMKRLFKVFSPQDAYAWFEQRGVPLVVQDDQCVFPAAQDSQAVIDCFLALARHYRIEIRTQHAVASLADAEGFDYVAVTTGGSPQGRGLQWLADLGHEIERPVPSLFTFAIDDARLTALQGLVVADVVAYLPGTKMRAVGPLLITHGGMSGPAILRLSSYAARHLADAGYRSPLGINWTGRTEDEVRSVLMEQTVRQPRKQLATYCPLGLQLRLWAYLLEKALAARSQIRWADANQKDINRLVNVLCNDSYLISGRAAFKEEFVTCGGISLRAVDPATLESRHVPRLYFAGEVLDVDGITGGFNFQAAWTTAYTVARAIFSSFLVPPSSI
jgi:predicted Rossmann fold flavoprotein